MSKKYSKYPARWRRTIGTLSAVGAVGLLSGCESAPPALPAPEEPVVQGDYLDRPDASYRASVASFVDCKKEPRGTSSALTHPSKVGFEYFGDARQQLDGSLRWMSRIAVASYGNGFSIIVNGLETPMYPYETAPGSGRPNFTQGQRVDLLSQVANSPDGQGIAAGEVAFQVTRFDAADPSSFDNTVTVTWTCGNPIASPPVPTMPTPTA
jgi:hypothetical protein